MNDRILNIGLVPVEEEDRKSLIELSNRFSQSQKSLYNLGEDSIPHVTLAQVACNEDFPVEELAEYRHFDSTVIATTLGFAIDQNDGINYLWLRVYKSYVIERVHEIFCEMVEKRDDCRILNKKRRFYDPHFTLASWRNNLPVPSFKPDEELMNKPIKTKFAIGVSGDYYQFKKVLISL